MDILKHQLERYGVVTVMDVLMLDNATKAPVLYLDTLKVSSISTEGQQKEIRGGVGADLLLTYNYGRTIGLEMTDALVSLYSLKKLWGAEINAATAGVKKIKFHEIITPASGASALVSNHKYYVASPVVVSDYTVYDLDNSAGTAATITQVAVGEDGKTTFTVTGFNAAHKYYIEGYLAEASGTDLNPAEVVLKSNHFPTAVTIIGHTMFLDQKTGKQVLAEIEIPKFMFSNSFNFSLDAEGDASTFNFSGNALVDPDTKEILKIKTINRGDNVLNM